MPILWIKEGSFWNRKFGVCTPKQALCDEGHILLNAACTLTLVLGTYNVQAAFLTPWAITASRLTALIMEFMDVTLIG